MSERNAPVDEALDTVLVEMAEACIAGDIRATAAAVRKAHARLFEALAEERAACAKVADDYRKRATESGVPEIILLGGAAQVIRNSIRARTP